MSIKVTEKKPKVSVCVVTYNHEKYIRQCLQSIVDQKTDFDFEVIVGEDCSTDGTREIVKEFILKHPDIIKPIYHNQNIGPTQNYASVHREARGEYIAHVDGDDYWLQDKLQYQAELLEKKTDLIFVADNLSANENCDEKVINLTGEELFLNDNPAMHSSKMYRSNFVVGIKNGREYLDFEIHLRQLYRNGKCGLTSRRTIVHRANSESSVRRNVNLDLVKSYISLCDFSATLGIDKVDICRIFDRHMRPFIKLAAYTSKKEVIDKLIFIINNSSYALSNISVLYMFLIRYSYGKFILRLLRSIKRKACP